MSDATDRRSTLDRRVPENLMGRRASDRFDLGEWLVTNYVDPRIDAKFEVAHGRFAKTVSEAIAKAFADRADNDTGRDSARDWRTVIIAVGSCFAFFLVAGSLCGLYLVSKGVI